MLAVGIVLSITGLGFLCWLLFTLAICALPTFAGLSTALAAFHIGAGLIGPLAVGWVAGGALLALGQFVFAATRTPLLRDLIGMAYGARCDSRLLYVVCPGRHRHAQQRMADGIRHRRRRRLGLHGLLTSGAVGPAAGRAGHRERLLA